MKRILNNTEESLEEIDISKFRMDDYILDLIEKRKSQIRVLNKEIEDYPHPNLLTLRSRYEGGINDLYMVLTAYNNPLSIVRNQTLHK